MSDRDSIARVLDGDTKTFGQLVQRYQKLIYRLAYSYVGNHDDADDLVQSIFLRAYDKLSSFRGESAFKTWLYRIGVNHCLNHVAKDQRRKEQQLESLPEIASPDPTPLDTFSRKWKEEVIRQAIRRLPEKQQKVVILRAVEGFTYREIAEILNCPIQTAKTNYHYGVKTLRRLIFGEKGE